MAPKKNKGKSNADIVVFSEVERTLLGEQVAECNRKIARVRSTLQEYEIRNEELQNDLEKLDEDRADIIAFLRKQLNVKTDEYVEMKEKVVGLEELRERENTEFRQTVSELQKKFTRMKDQLTSENKFLAGKLNTLEEFRYIRDDLMKKFNLQEQQFKDQEMLYKRIIYDNEKKFVIGKDKLKKEMEARLLQLAQDFQDASESRIAASTHRVIRENIALKNELEGFLYTHQKLSELNEKYKEDIKAAQIAKELAEEERDTAINKSIVQLKVIDQLTVAFEKIKKEKALTSKNNNQLETLEAKIAKLSKENDNLTLQTRILEQNLHAKIWGEKKGIVDASNMTRERDKLRKLLNSAAIAIKKALKLDEWVEADPGRQPVNRQLLLSHLLQIVTQFNEIQETESLDTITSLSNIYNAGDIGFIPKPDSKVRISHQSAASRFSQKQLSESLKGERRESSEASSVLSSSPNESLETIPSIEVLPELPAKEIPVVKASLESLVTSMSSEESKAPSRQDSICDIGKQLQARKLEIQKSILKDLAFSQMSVKRQSQSSLRTPSQMSITRRSSTLLRKKPVAIIENPDIKELSVENELLEKHYLDNAKVSDTESVENTKTETVIEEEDVKKKD